MGTAPRLVAAVFLITPVASSAPGHVAAVSIASLPSFHTARATQNCPRDKVVWLNTDSGIYHQKGMRCTKYGAFAGRKTDFVGEDRDTQNGQ